MIAFFLYTQNVQLIVGIRRMSSYCFCTPVFPCVQSLHTEQLLCSRISTCVFTDLAYGTAYVFLNFYMCVYFVYREQHFVFLNFKFSPVYGTSLCVPGSPVYGTSLCVPGLSSNLCIRNSICVPGFNFKVSPVYGTAFVFQASSYHLCMEQHLCSRLLSSHLCMEQHFCVPGFKFYLFMVYGKYFKFSPVYGTAFVFQASSISSFDL